MNLDWKTFLLNQQVLTDEAKPAANVIGDRAVFAVVDFGVLSVSGRDAATLLQGQITCNVNELNTTRSSLAAMCNPKGRVIAVLLLVKNADGFLLILPVEMLETVKKRLQMYVLRSQVNISDGSDAYCLLGLSEPGEPSPRFVTQNTETTITVNFPAACNRKLLITDTETAIRLWQSKLDYQGYRKANQTEWRYLDTVSGIPWVTQATSEEYIPQMLNLDKLGGISFNKGCYTGQEIVARTHYLGKTKREMFLAECQSLAAPELNANIVNLDNQGQEIVGKVFRVQPLADKVILQVILQLSDSRYDNLGFQDNQQQHLNIFPITYD